MCYVPVHTSCYPSLPNPNIFHPATYARFTFQTTECSKILYAFLYGRCKNQLFLPATITKLLCIRNNYQYVMVFSNLDMSFIIMFECSMSQIQLIKETPLWECSSSFLQLQNSYKNVCQDKMHKSNGRNTFATPS